jgi:signal transduction histidine kinase
MRFRIRPQLLFYGVVILLIATAVASLRLVENTFERDLETNVDGLRRVFSDENVMKTLSDPRIRFSAIEELVAKYENHGYFGRIVVTKQFGSGERPIYPFYLPATSELSWRDAFQRSGDVRILQLQVYGQNVGSLYVQLRLASLSMVRMVLGALSALLIAAVALFVLQFRRQERVITRTTVELEEKRRELMKLERLALAGQLSANIFHDLKKPILNIKNEIEELEPVPDSLPAAAPARIREQVNTFFTILRESNLERFVRSEGEREYVDINEILDRSIGLVRYERGGCEVSRDYAPDVPPVLAHPVRLIQVFSNIVLNAYQAMNGRGELTVRTGREKDWAVVEISDTGPGIPKDSIERIFYPFFTTKSAEAGTGLGLYITQDIVREMGGSIGVRSSASGTTFDVRIPSGPSPAEGRE